MLAKNWLSMRLSLLLSRRVSGTKKESTKIKVPAQKKNGGNEWAGPPNSKDSISFIISAWKMSGEPAIIPIGNLLYEYLPQGKMIVQILDASESNLMV